MQKSTYRKILFVHDYLLGPGDCGSTRIYEFMVVLKSKGYEISAITSGYNPLTGGKLNVSKFDKKLKIEKYPAIPPQNSPLLRMFALFLNMILIFPKLFFSSIKNDLLYFTTPPIFTGIPILLVNYLLKIPYILEIRDLWPESGVHLGYFRRNSPVYMIMSEVERRLIENSSSIVVLTRGIGRELKRKYPNVPISIIHNGVLRKKIYEREDGGKVFPLKLVFFGNITGSSDPMTIIEVAEYFGEKIEIHIAGDGRMREELFETIRNRKIENINYHGVIENSQMMDFLHEMDLSIVPIREGKFFDCVVSNKLLDSMAAGIPVILLGNGESAEIVEKSGCGVVIERGSEEMVEMEEFMDKIMKDKSLGRLLGTRGQKFILRNFLREDKAELVDGIIKRCLLKR